MQRRTTRLLAPLAAVGLMAVLAACGGDKADDPKASDSASASASASSSAAAMTDGTVDGITVKGAVGKAPEVTWADEGVTATDPVRQVVTTGDGATVENGDKVFVQIWVGNGTTKKEAYSSFAGKPSALVVSAAQTLADPGRRDRGPDHRLPAPDRPGGDRGVQRPHRQPRPQARQGRHRRLRRRRRGRAARRSRRAPTRPLPSGRRASPRPATCRPRSTSPAPPSRPASSCAPRSSRAREPAVEAGDHVYVNYLGQVYNGKQPFDDSYSKGQPFDFDLGAGGVIKGWDQGLAGVTVGSRVIVQIPPSWGYGKAGAPQVGISGTDTLYFVVDILGAT